MLDFEQVAGAVILDPGDPTDLAAVAKRTQASPIRSA
jgi:hypothetical protein